MAKAFISFLGTNDYLDCRYSLNQQPGGVVKYVQEDIVARFCRGWDSRDEIRVFTTDEARQRNWDDDGHVDRKTKEIKSNLGLGNRLTKMNLSAAVKQYDIPVGNSEEEIWDIFQAVYNSLGQGDEIIFDITHGFRSIPMLFMVLIGYARLLKGISVEGVYYGAFEGLGNIQDAIKIDQDQRIAPIFDLTSFEQLIEWTGATQSFVKNGSAKELASLVQTKIAPVLRESRGQDKVASAINKIVKGIDQISSNLLVNRGAEIIQYDYGRIKKSLQSLQSDQIFIRPLAPLMSVIENKIDTFVKDDIKNGFQAVEWCIDHGLHQQAVTMLLENMVTYILAGEGVDWGAEKNRTAASRAIILASNKSLTFDEDPTDSELVRLLMKNPMVTDLAREYEALREIRNDINHGGYLTEQNKKARTADSILHKFHKIRDAIYEKLQEC